MLELRTSCVRRLVRGVRVARNPCASGARAREMRERDALAAERRTSDACEGYEGGVVSEGWWLRSDLEHRHAAHRSDHTTCAAPARKAPRRRPTRPCGVRRRNAAPHTHSSRPPRARCRQPTPRGDPSALPLLLHPTAGDAAKGAIRHVPCTEAQHTARAHTFAGQASAPRAALFDWGRAGAAHCPADRPGELQTRRAGTHAHT